MATLYWSPGDHWARSILLSMCLVLSRRVLLVSMRAGDCGGKMQPLLLHHLTLKREKEEIQADTEMDTKISTL